MKIKTKTYMKIIKLLDMINENQTELWCSNLDFTIDCIVLENIKLSEMVYQDQKNEDDFEDRSFNGNDIIKLIKEIKNELNIMTYENI